jgi:glycogen debranching enzyme
MPLPRQPLLHAETVVLRAPCQAWSGPDGSMLAGRFHGIFVSDIRLVSALAIRIGDEVPEHLSTSSRVDEAHFSGLLRALDGSGADPDVRFDLTRSVMIDGIDEEIEIRSRRADPIPTEVVVVLTADASSMDLLKAGLAHDDVAEPIGHLRDGDDRHGHDDHDGLVVTAMDGGATWGGGGARATLSAPGARVEIEGAEITLRWTVEVPARGSTAVRVRIRADDELAVVRGVTGPVPWSVPTVASSDSRLERWVDVALDDLDGLRMERPDAPGAAFLAAGAPWFFTLFGRDSLWAARMLLPLGTRLAGDTLRVLAELQGTVVDPASAEQPGKIMHELRRATLEIPGEGISLPPLYFGTVDATALWVCLLHDAWRWGLPDDEVRALLPHLMAALEWMRDFGDSDHDGLLEYVDDTGSGLSNQGWKDSGDSVQWRDGRLAQGPIALCEVQAYAFEAAKHGADLLDHFGEPGGADWRSWADRVKKRFHETFWIESPDGAYPAIALDADKRPVDTVTSNLGHLLGTGLLDPTQAALVARRLVSPELDSGYGLRTMSTDSAGYWPLSYHGGAVWAHDTAIAITGLSREGHHVEAAQLSAGLLAAAEGFDYRMPELHAGDWASRTSSPIPYPAACRPQAWSAAAAVSVLVSTLGLEPDAPGGVLGVAIRVSATNPLSVTGLVFAQRPFSLDLDSRGEVVSASGAPIEVR